MIKWLIEHFKSLKTYITVKTQIRRSHYKAFYHKTDRSPVPGCYGVRLQVSSWQNNKGQKQVVRLQGGIKPPKTGYQVTGCRLSDIRVSEYQLKC